MRVLCRRCGGYYDDAKQFVACPHDPRPQYPAGAHAIGNPRTGPAPLFAEDFSRLVLAKERRYRSPRQLIRRPAILN